MRERESCSIFSNINETNQQRIQYYYQHSTHYRERERERELMMSSEVSSAAMKEVEVEVEVEEEEELELGLSLGANNNSNSRKQYCCRILTAKDFPAAAAASPMSPSSSVSSSRIDRAPPPPSQVVGWPPIRAFRMNSLVSQSKDNTPHDADTANLKKGNHNHSLGVCNESVGIKSHDKKRGGHGLHAASRFVKVNKDGDPIGRKVDLGAHASYETLAIALELMFRKPTAVLISSLENSMKASKLLDGSSEFALTYEDKDGDWMLVGDVPYRMFLDTAKRLRIMRTSDANGLAPRFQSSTGGVS